MQFDNIVGNHHHIRQHVECFNYVVLQLLLELVHC